MTRFDGSAAAAAPEGGRRRCSCSARCGAADRGDRGRGRPRLAGARPAPGGPRAAGLLRRRRRPGGANTVAEAAFARCGLVCMPRPRPFGEQVARGEDLERDGAAVVLGAPPEPRSGPRCWRRRAAPARRSWRLGRRRGRRACRRLPEALAAAPASGALVPATRPSADSSSSQPLAGHCPSARGSGGRSRPAPGRPPAAVGSAGGAGGRRARRRARPVARRPAPPASRSRCPRSRSRGSPRRSRRSASRKVSRRTAKLSDQKSSWRASTRDLAGGGKRPAALRVGPRRPRSSARRRRGATKPAAGSAPRRPRARRAHPAPPRRRRAGPRGDAVDVEEDQHARPAPPPPARCGRGPGAAPRRRSGSPARRTARPRQRRPRVLAAHPADQELERGAVRCPVQPVDQVGEMLGAIPHRHQDAELGAMPQALPDPHSCRPALRQTPAGRAVRAPPRSPRCCRRQRPWRGTRGTLNEPPRSS